jgi:hypothetical protein
MARLVSRMVLLSVAALAVAPAGAQALSVSVSGPPSGAVFKRFSQPREFTLTATGDSSGCTGTYWVSVLIKPPNYNGGLIPAGSSLNESTFVTTRDTADGPGVYEWAGQIRCGFDHVESETRTFTISDAATPPPPPPPPPPVAPKRPSARDDCELADLFDLTAGRPPYRDNPFRDPAAFGSLGPLSGPLDPAARATALSPTSKGGQALRTALQGYAAAANRLNPKIESADAALFLAVRGLNDYAPTPQQRAEIDTLARNATALREQYDALSALPRKIANGIRAKFGCGRPIAATTRELRLSAAEKRKAESNRSIGARGLAREEALLQRVCFVDDVVGVAKTVVTAPFKALFKSGVAGGGATTGVPTGPCDLFTSVHTSEVRRVVDADARAAADPPRGDFDTPTKVPPVAAVGFAGLGPGAGSLEALTKAAARQGVTASALVTALERAQGAVLARDRPAARRQLAAAQHLARELQAASVGRYGAARAAVKAMRRAGVGATLHLDAPTARFIATLRPGLESNLARSMMSRGLGAASIAESLRREAAKPVPASGTVRFPDVLLETFGRTELRAQGRLLRTLERRLAAVVHRLGR